jgi:hypothetical protein
MKKYSILLFLCLCVILCTSCQQIMNWALNGDKEDSFTIPLEAYYGTDLRLDGYFYRKHDTENIYRICFLYKDGVCKLSTENAKSIEALDSLIIKDDWKKYPHIIWACGVFRITESKKISFQIWMDHKTREPINITGNIINDSALLITVPDLIKNDCRISRPDEEYHFRRLSPRPDSLDHYGPEDILIH